MTDDDDIRSLVSQAAYSGFWFGALVGFSFALVLTSSGLIG